MTLDAGDTLVRALQNHNPWWEDGLDAFSLPARQKSDFYHLVRPEEAGSQFEDTRLLGLVGRRGVGKTTLFHQFVHQQISDGVDPERFLYVPFDADPLYQLQSDEQLKRAVRYYESRVLGGIATNNPHFLLFDDVHQIEHPNKPGIDGWGEPVLEMIADTPGRHVAVTASAGVQVEREIERTKRDFGDYDIQPILPEKFRDYLFSLYPELESDETRVSPTSLRTGEHSLQTALDTGDIEPFIGELRRKYDQVADAERRIQTQVADYLAMGGIISFEHGGAVASASELSPEDYTRLREDVRTALYQEVTGFESIQTIADLERLCAVAARSGGSKHIRYQELVSLFDVDRRTIADSYLPALEALYVLSGVTEYDNSRPRSVRLYLRDTGLVTALTDGDPAAVLNDFDRETELARVAGFDHAMRFAYGIAAEQGYEVHPTVEYWEGRDGTVDYVFEIGDTPVPVGFAYRSRERESSLGAVQEFMGAYDAPVGFLLAGDTVRGGEAVEVLEEGVIQMPYWLFLVLS